MLVIGDEAHHLVESPVNLCRVLIVYVQGKGMAEYEAGCQKVAALLAVIAEDGGLTEESATTEDIETMLRAESMQVRWLKSHMGLWQLAAYMQTFVKQQCNPSTHKKYGRCTET